MTFQLKIPPVVVSSIAGLAMWLVAREVPAWRVALPHRGATTLVIAALAFAVAGLGVARFVQAKTTVHPIHPERASTLVTGGIFRVSRNPMYVGLLVLLIAWAAWLESPLALVVLPGFVGYMNRYQIAPEEAALQARFGAEYEAYRRRVRRWL